MFYILQSPVEGQLLFFPLLSALEVHLPPEFHQQDIAHPSKSRIQHTGSNRLIEQATFVSRACKKTIQGWSWVPQTSLRKIKQAHEKADSNVTYHYIKRRSARGISDLGKMLFGPRTALWKAFLDHMIWVSLAQRKSRYEYFWMTSDINRTRRQHSISGTSKRWWHNETVSAMWRKPLHIL